MCSSTTHPFYSKNYFPSLDLALLHDEKEDEEEDSLVLSMDHHLDAWESLDKVNDFFPFSVQISLPPQVVADGVHLSLSSSFFHVL